MRKSWITAPILGLLVLSVTACPHPLPTCEPGDVDCEESPDPEPEPVLTKAEAEAQLGAIHEAYARASVDGLDAGECRELAASYQGLHDLDPTIATARFNVAAVHEACGQADRAEQIYLELAERSHPQALNNLGVLAWGRGEHERAMELFQRSVEADHIHALEARNNLAMALRERYAEKAVVADFDSAQAQLQKILALDSSNKGAYENLARLYYDRGRLEDRSYLVMANLVVIQAQRVFGASDQHSADLHNLRGLLLMEDDNQVHALRAFQRAVELEPKHADANRNIAMIAIRFRDYESAERALEAVIQLESVAADVEAWLALGVAKRGLRKFDESEAAYRQALDVDGSDPRPWFNLGILAQEHLVADADDEDALTEVYELALERYETFVDHAGTTRRWRASVNEAKDRMVVIEDSIETIEKMKEIEEAYQLILEEEQRQWALELERRKKRELEGTSVAEITGG